MSFGQNRLMSPLEQCDFKILPCLSNSLNVSQEKRRKESKEPPSVAEYVLSAAILLSHSCSLQHSWVLGQEKALSIHLSWSPYAGVSCKYECWRASSASTDTKLCVVSQNHNLLIPADSWDEQKHAGVKLCKLTLLNYSSVAACARECSVHITHEGSCGGSRWRGGWGSCCPWLQCGKSGRHHGKIFVSSRADAQSAGENSHQEFHFCLTADSRSERRGQGSVGGLGWNKSKPFWSLLPAPHSAWNCALEKSEFTLSKPRFLQASALSPAL